MGSGYVLDFSNSTLQQFVAWSVGLDIYDSNYSGRGDSKAKRLRELLRIEQNHICGKLIADLVEHAKSTIPPPDDKVLENCQRIAERLRAGAPVLVSLPPEAEQPTFQALANEVRRSIEANKPEAGLDRLHTYLAAYLRVVCEDNGITVEKDEPINSYLGKYVKALKVAKRIESDMTTKIMMYSIHVIEAFNKVRNEQSLAHPNEMLNYDEALLIFQNVVAMVHFVAAIERKAPRPSPRTLFDPTAIGDGKAADDIPF